MDFIITGSISSLAKNKILQDDSQKKSVGFDKLGAVQHVLPGERGAPDLWPEDEEIRLESENEAVLRQNWIELV